MGKGMSNEVRARIICAYYPKTILYMGDELAFKSIDTHNYKIRAGGMEFPTLNYVKVPLKNLSDITDEDAMEVAKIAGVYMPVITRYIHYIILDGSNGKLGKQLKHRSVRVYFSVSNTRVIEDKFEVIEYCLPIFDYLRSKSYNCGYGEFTPQQLIDNNIVQLIK